MKKQLFMDINVGIGDHLFLRVFMDGVKDQYDRIAITHSRPGMKFWHNDNSERWNFNLQLGKLVFSEAPYMLVPNAHYPFFPNERIIREVNKKPVKPNLNCLCGGNSLGINKYIVITTKVRQFPLHIFSEYKDKLSEAFRDVAKEYTIVILGEREVEKTREYTAECNKNQVFGIYDFLISILPKEKILDLTVPALGVKVSTFPQFQQDCLIMKEANAVVAFGIGGNFWMSTCIAENTIALRAENGNNDNEWTTDLMQGFPGLSLTKNIDEFCSFLKNLPHN